jgi:hypothetical protein
MTRLDCIGQYMWLRRVKDTETWKDDQRSNVSQPAE